MTMPLIKTTDRRQGLTGAEVDEVALKLKKETDVTLEFSTIKTIDRRNQYFYGYRIKMFPTFPQFIGQVHEKYGRKIDIQVYFIEGTKGYVDLYIRGLSKELHE